MTLVRSKHRRLNCIRRNAERTWCGNAYDREVYGFKAKNARTCDACFVAFVAALEGVRT